MNSKINNQKLSCVACRKKRKLNVNLSFYQLSPSLGIYICTTNECLFPLNAKNLHKFVYKITEDGVRQTCDPNEVPNLKDLFSLLSTKNSFNIQTESTEKLSTSECVELIPEKQNQSVSESYGTKFVSSRNYNVFPIWENKDALCWLDTTLCLLVHSKNLKMYFKLESFGDCQLKDISVAYDEAVSILNAEKNGAARLPHQPFDKLEKVREKTFEFLQPFQRCEKGQEDSPVFAIMALLKENKYLNSLFLMCFTLELKCSSCGYMKISRYRKTLVTIPAVLQEFSENELSYLRPCFQCQKPDQRIILKFLKLPPLLMMHFVEGLPHSNFASYDSVFAQKGYCVRGFVQYIEPERHFITWVRDDTGDQWMCCDDLNPPVQQFKAKLPDISASEIHIVMWEKKIKTGEESLLLHYSDDECYNDSLSSIESASPPLIILSDSDSESAKEHCPLQKVTPVQNKSFLPPQKGNILQKDTSDCDLVLVQESVKDYVRDNKEHSESVLISSSVPEQNLRSSNDSCISLLNEGQFLQDVTDTGKQHKSASCSAFNVLEYENSAECNSSITDTSLMSHNVVLKSKSPVCCIDSNSEVTGKDVQDENSHSPCEEPEDSLNTGPENGISSVESHGICGHILEDALHVGESGPPLPGKMNYLCTDSPVKDLTENTSDQLGHAVKEEAVFNQNNKSSARDHDDDVCKTIRPCIVRLDRSVVELHIKKLTGQNSGHSARPSRKGKGKHVTAVRTMIPSAVPVMDRKRSKKKKPATLKKQSGFDSELQDMSNVISDTHVIRSSELEPVITAPCDFTSVCVVPDERCTNVKSEKLRNSTVESLKSAGHSSDLPFPETKDTIFPSALSPKKQQENTAETSINLNASNIVPSKEQQNTVSQNGISDYDGTRHLSSGSVNLNQAATNVTEHVGDYYVTVKKDIKTECLDRVPSETSAKRNASNKVSFSSNLTEHNKNLSLRTQTLSNVNLPSVHSISQRNLNSSSKSTNISESLGEEKSSVSADLSENKNSSVVSLNEVSKTGISTIVEPNGNKISSYLCDEGCTCDLCSVRRFLQSHEHCELEAQDKSHDTKVLGKTNEISDEKVNLKSSESTVSLVVETEQGLNVTIPLQTRNPPKKPGSVHPSAQEDNSLLEKRSKQHNKMPTRKCAASKQTQSTVSKRKGCKNKADMSEVSQEQKDYVDHLPEKDITVSQLAEKHGDTDKTCATMTEITHIREKCQNMELGHDKHDESNAVVKAGSVSAGSPHSFEPSVQENLHTEQEKACESSEKQVMEETQKNFTSGHPQEQMELYTGDEKIVPCEKSDPCKSINVSKRGKRQKHSKESDISVPICDSVVPKKQSKCTRDKSGPTGKRCVPFSGDNSSEQKRKIERKFEPDRVKFVEVPVDGSSLTVEKRTPLAAGTSRKRSARNVIKYGGITAVFEDFVEGDLLELTSLASDRHVSVSAVSSSQPSQNDADNTERLSCEPEKQDAIAASNMNLPANDAMSVFDSVDQLRAHLHLESPDGSADTGSCENVRLQSDMLYSPPTSIRGHKKLYVQKKGVEGGRKKFNSRRVLNSEKSKTSAQTSSNQHRKQWNKELHTDIPPVKQKRNQRFNYIAKKDKDYLTAVKKMICGHSVVTQSLENQNKLQASKHVITPSKSVTGTKDITTDASSKTKETSVSPSKVQTHSGATRGILTDKKGRKKSKTVRFSIGPDESSSELGRKKSRGTSSSEPRASNLQETVDVKGGIKNIAMAKKVYVKKRTNLGGMSSTSKKKMKGETPSSPVLKKSEKQNDRSLVNDGKPVAVSVKPGNLHQETKSPTSNRPLGLVDPFMFCPRDLTLNYGYSVSVPRPQVTRITDVSKETRSSENS